MAVFRVRELKGPVSTRSRVFGLVAGAVGAIAIRSLLIESNREHFVTLWPLSICRDTIPLNFPRVLDLGDHAIALKRNDGRKESRSQQPGTLRKILVVEGLGLDVLGARHQMGLGMVGVRLGPEIFVFLLELFDIFEELGVGFRQV